ncbi:MAG: hypothetical protein IK130_00055 [Oscillospiraceae bacterium]|nr:hypothetical protein [Oscillospiraceae bacterium]
MGRRNDDYDLRDRYDEDYDVRDADDDGYSVRGYDDLPSQDDYFKNGHAQDIEEDNPFERPTKKKKSPAKKSSEKGEPAKKKESLIVVLKQNIKKIAIGAAILAVIIIGIIIAATISKRKNDGAKFARSLADSINRSIAAAKKQTTDIELAADSQYPAVNSVFYMYNEKAESKKSVTLEGMTFPQWLIVCDKDGDNLAGVKFFDFRTLNDSVYGEKRKAYIDPKTIAQAGATIEQVETALDLQPYCTQYLRDKTHQRDYRYFYKDAETGDTVSYTISALFNESDVLTSISDSRANYMAGLLLSGIN